MNKSTMYLNKWAKTKKRFKTWLKTYLLKTVLGHTTRCKLISHKKMEMK